MIMSAAAEVSDDSDLLLSEEERRGDLAGSGVPVVTSPPVPVRQWLSKSCDMVRRSWVVHEGIVLFKLGVPIILSLVFQQTLFFISLLFVGHITGRSLELDAAGLALSFGNVTGLSVGIGLASAADTLSSQAYGFKNYRKVGVILQRGILILSISMFPVLVIWLNTEPILLLLQQEPCVARLTAQYLEVYCFALPSVFVYQLLLKYLQTQGIVWALVVVGILVNLICVALHATFIFAADLGIVGASTAMVLSFTLAPLLLLIYMYARGLHKQTWDGWSWDSLGEWWQYIKLGAPGLLMLCCEWWSFEIVAFVAGSINETELGINSVLISLLSILFMLPLGLGIAAGIRVGNELGAGQPLKAKRSAYTAILIAAVCSVITCVLLLATRNVLGTIFTEDQEVIDGVAMAMYIVGPLSIPDQLQGTIAGVLRGSGRQAIASVVNFVSYYVFGLPLGIVLALVAGMDTFGLWTGLLVGDILQTIAYVSIVLLTDWEHQSKRAMKNAQDSSKGPPEEDNSSVSSETTSSSIGSGWSREQLVLSEDVKEEPVNSTKTVHATTISNGTVEEIPLVSDLDELEEEEEIVVRRKPSILRLSPSSKSHVKLLLYRSSFFVIGVAVLIAGGVASHYTSPSSSLDCYDLNTTDNVTMSLVVAPSSTVSAMSTVDLNHTAVYPYITPSPTLSL